MEEKTLSANVAHERMKILLKRVVCSVPWVEVVVPEIEWNGCGIRDLQSWMGWWGEPEPTRHLWKPDAYPPGRKESLMRRCTLCDRKCPPNTSLAPVCYDCEIESEEKRFLDRARRPGDGLASTLSALWWAEARLPGGPRRTRRNRSAQPNHFGDTVDADPFGAQLREATAGSALHLDEWDYWGEVPPPRRRSGGNAQVETPDCEPWKGGQKSRMVAQGYDEAVRKALDRSGRQSNRRPKVCEIELLPEDEGRLRKEIAFYNGGKRIMPSARRIHPHNEYEPFFVGVEEEKRLLARSRQSASRFARTKRKPSAVRPRFVRGYTAS